MAIGIIVSIAIVAGLIGAVPLGAFRPGPNTNEAWCGETCDSGACDYAECAVAYEGDMR